MQIISFLPHYQSVYTNFDFSSFSLISCSAKEPILQGKKACFARQKKACELSHVFSLQNKSAGIRGSRRGYGETEDQVQG